MKGNPVHLPIDIMPQIRSLRKKILICVSLILSNASCFAQTKTSYDNKNNFLLNGKTFFPFGCYGLYYTETQQNKVISIKEFSKAGLNIMCLVNADNDYGQTNFLKLLDTADIYKVYFLMGASNDSFLKKRAPSCLAKPALFGYTLADDADDANRISIEGCKTIQSDIKAIDKDRLTHLTLTGWNGARRAAAKDYIAIPDFCSYQCYPIGHHRNADITESKALTIAYERTLDYVKEAELQKKPFVHTPQTFTWASQSEIPRYPTVAELRNMVYSGLAAGVKGIISYDFSFDLINNQKPLWKEYSDLASDIRKVQYILFENKLTRHSTGDEELVVSSWRNGDTTLLVIVNTSYTSKKNLNQKIDWAVGNSLSPISDRLEKGLAIINGTVQGSISPQGTHVYKTFPRPTAADEQHGARFNISLHPNPAKKDLLVTGENIEDAAYSITTMDGKYVQIGNVHAGIIRLEDLETGIYLIKVLTQTGESVRRLVKE